MNGGPTSSGFYLDVYMRAGTSEPPLGSDLFQHLDRDGAVRAAKLMRKVASRTVRRSETRDSLLRMAMALELYLDEVSS